MKGIAAEWLGGSDTSPRLHLNLIWTYRTQPGTTARDDQREFGVACSMLDGYSHCLNGAGAYPCWLRP